MQNSRRRCGAEYKNGDPWENRTPDFAVRGRRLSRLTKGPYFGEKAGFSPNKEKSRHLPIFPGRLQPSIFGTTELNYCVRNGNRCTLVTINTYYFVAHSCAALLLYHTISLLSTSFLKKFGDPWENRTPVCGVRGRRLSRLTNGPLVRLHGFEPGTH